MYANILVTVNAVHILIEKKLDEVSMNEDQLHTMDVLKVISLQIVEEKAHYLAVFMNKGNHSFHPCIIVVLAVNAMLELV